MPLKFSGKTALSVGMVAAAGASACCIGPLLLLALGIGGAWAGGFAALEQYRCLFVALTFVFLGTAYWQLYRSPPACASDVLCSEPKTVHFRRLSFWVIVGLSLALILFPYIGPQFYADEELNEAVLSADSVNVPLQTSTLHIDNLTCESCVISVRKSLRTVPGHAKAQVDLETGLAKITYDPKLVSVDELTAAIGKAGYSASPQKEALHE